MSLQTRLEAFAAAVGADIKQLNTQVSASGAAATTVIDGGGTPSESYDGITVGVGDAVRPTLLDAKGDMYVASGPDTVARLPVGGTDGYVLTVDPASSVGMSWEAPPAPASMVTTDTDQDIFGVKKFLSSGGKPQIQVGPSGTVLGLGTGLLIMYNATTTDNGTTWYAIDPALGASAIQMVPTGFNFYVAPVVAAGAPLAFVVEYSQNATAADFKNNTVTATSSFTGTSFRSTAAGQWSRFVGAVSTGAPTTGTWTAGDWAFARDTGHIWQCTVAGTPGTWVDTGLVSVSDLIASGTRDNTTFLRGDGTWAVPGGGAGTPPGRPAVTQLADQPIQVTAFTDITDLFFAMLANTSYEIEGTIFWTVAATTTGWRFGIAGPGAALASIYSEYNSTTSAEGIITQQHNNTALTPSMAAITSSPFAAVPNMMNFRGYIRNGATAGNLRAQFASELTTAAVTVLRGSYMTYKQV